MTNPLPFGNMIPNMMNMAKNIASNMNQSNSNENLQADIAAAEGEIADLQEQIDLLLSDTDNQDNADLIGIQNGLNTKETS